MASAALPLATAALGSFGGGGAGAGAPPPPMMPAGPSADAAAFRSAGINVGSRVVGRGNASTDGQSSKETQSATATAPAAADPLGASYPSSPAGAWYTKPGVIAAAVGGLLVLVLAVVLIAKKRRK